MFARDIGMLEPAARHEIDDDGQGLPGCVKVNALHVPRVFNPQRSFKQFVLHERTPSRIDPFLTSLPTQNSKEASFSWRLAEVAKLMMDAGLIVMTAFISTFRQEREMARELIGAENFVEVFVNTPLAVCGQRDPKGLYKKARSGQLPNMTGINSPYEAPLKPDVILRTNLENPDQMVREIVEHLIS
jgi:hypothetical protein